MRNIWVRPAIADDKPLATEWWARIANENHIDPDVLEYPSTVVMTAEKDGEPICFMPVQNAIVAEPVNEKAESVMMCEALAPKEDLSGLDMAKALDKFLTVLTFKAKELGIGEIHMPCTDENVIALAEARGFVKSSVPTWILKV
jgi:hypothetical protein